MVTFLEQWTRDLEHALCLGPSDLEVTILDARYAGYADRQGYRLRRITLR